MHIDIKSALAGAVCGALISSVLGPIAVTEYRLWRSSSVWKGTWHTITCKGGEPTGHQFEMTFTQWGDVVQGSYNGIGDTSKGFDGFIGGTASVAGLKGSWHSYKVEGAGGQFTFLLSPDGTAFRGQYNDGDQERLWVGNRTAMPETCKI